MRMDRLLIPEERLAISGKLTPIAVCALKMPRRNLTWRLRWGLILGAGRTKFNKTALVHGETNSLTSRSSVEEGAAPSTFGLGDLGVGGMVILVEYGSVGEEGAPERAETSVGKVMRNMRDSGDFGLRADWNWMGRNVLAVGLLSIWVDSLTPEGLGGGERIGWGYIRMYHPSIGLLSAIISKV